MVRGATEADADAGEKSFQPLVGYDWKPHGKLVGEAKASLEAIITGEQVYFQKPQSNATYTDIADASEASVKLGVDLAGSSERWTFSVSGASSIGFVAEARGRDDSKAERLVVSVRYVRLHLPVWTVVPARGQHRAKDEPASFQDLAP